MGKPTTFKGKITNIAFFSEDSSWGAIDVQSTEDIPYSTRVYDYDIETNKTSELFSIRVVGKMAEPYVGAIVEVTGVHSFNPKYKKDQITIEKIDYPKPSNPKENSSYLKSLVTERQAESLLNAYPNIVEEIIKGDDNVDFSLLPGIGQVTYDKIRDKIVSNFAISDVLSLLTPLGISFSKIQRMLENEKNPKILREKIIRNPYFLVNFPGISFKTADKIAIQLNPSLRMSEERLAAFVKFYFTDIGENAGHTYTTINELRSGVIENIAECDKFFDEWIQKETNKEKLVHIEDDKIGLKYYYDSERFIWNKIIELDKTVPLFITEENITEGIRIAEEELGFSLTEEQRDVVVNMTKNNFCLSTGKSGTGKTTTARALLNIYKHAGYSVVVAAFSAKASRRATQATGFNGMTLHKLLGIGKDANKQKKNNEEDNVGTIPFDILFVDENSMNPLFLMRKIFELVGKAPIKIVLCGDNKQINPIGVGNIFSDLLEKDCFNKNVLTKIQRQAADSGIIVDGNMIRESIDPIDVKEPRVIHGVKKDLIYVFKNDKEEIFRLAVSSYLKSVKDKGIGNVILLVPFKTKGLNCTKEFNKVIQREVNVQNENIKFKHGDLEFWMNDYVIHLKNNYTKEIMNGSTGFVKLVESNRIVVDFEGDEVEYTHDDIGELGLAYALTTFKFQGSESRDCIVVMDGSHWILLSTAYLYTSMTRAKERCLIITDMTAYNRCMVEDKSQRNTWMKEMI